MCAVLGRRVLSSILHAVVNALLTPSRDSPTVRYPYALGGSPFWDKVRPMSDVDELVDLHPGAPSTRIPHDALGGSSRLPLRSTSCSSERRSLARLGTSLSTLQRMGRSSDLVASRQQPVG